jgi:hypothetical protein
MHGLDVQRPLPRDLLPCFRGDSMHRMIMLVVSLVGALPTLALAQVQPLVRAAALHVPLPTFDTVDFKLPCPAGYVPNNYSARPQYPYDVNEDQYRLFVDPSGSQIDKSTLTSSVQLDGAGYSISAYNTEHHDKNLEALAMCVATAASTDNTFQIVQASGNVTKSSQGTVTAFCPADSPVAFGGFSNADAVFVYDYGGAPVWGTSASPIVLNSLSDGTTMGPPTGWQVRVFNAFSTSPVIGFALCGKAPSMKAYIYAVASPPSAFGQPIQFSIFAPVPEGWTAVNMGYDGGTIAQYLASDMWLDDGTVVGIMDWYANSKAYNSGSAQVRAFMARGNGTGSGGHASVAVLALPTGSPTPPTTVAVVEFYNAHLDHYFMTANADEMAKLDNGTFQGWARTGQTFSAYGLGSSGRTGRHPVCREYGNPLYGLDSHFYSASPDECFASLTTTNGAWLLEASEVFEMDLPDPVTGACPAGGVPVYRIWNQRKDSNHRYTTSIAIRDQMVAKGGIAEGYGPNAVALCGLP